MVDILESVSLEAVRALAQCFSFTRLDARDAVLVAPDEHAERLLLLVEGRARVHEEGDQGRGLTVSVVEGETLIGATGFAPCPWRLHIEALESSIICGVGRQAFEELVARNATLGMRVARLLGERLIEIEGRRANIVRKEVPERLASQILRPVESEGGGNPGRLQDTHPLHPPATGRHDRCQPEGCHPSFREVAVGGRRGGEESSYLRHRPGSLEAGRRRVSGFKGSLAHETVR
jgi:hypothetical protein